MVFLLLISKLTISFSGLVEEKVVDTLPDLFTLYITDNINYTLPKLIVIPKDMFNNKDKFYRSLFLYLYVFSRKDSLKHADAMINNLINIARKGEGDRFFFPMFKYYLSYLIYSKYISSFKKNDIDEALKVFSDIKYYKYHNIYQFAKLLRTWMFISIGSEDEAIKEINSIAGIDSGAGPENDFLLIYYFYSLGIINFNKGEYQKSYDNFSSAVAQIESEVTQLPRVFYFLMLKSEFYKGISAYKNGDYINARESLEDLKDKDLEGYRPFIHYWLGKIYLHDGKTEEALREFQEAKSVNNGLWKIHYMAEIGNIYLQENKLREAFDEYNRIIVTAQPKDKEVAKELVSYFYNTVLRTNRFDIDSLFIIFNEFKNNIKDDKYVVLYTVNILEALSMEDSVKMSDFFALKDVRFVLQKDKRSYFNYLSKMIRVNVNLSAKMYRMGDSSDVVFMKRAYEYTEDLSRLINLKRYSEYLTDEILFDIITGYYAVGVLASNKPNQELFNHKGRYYFDMVVPWIKRLRKDFPSSIYLSDADRIEKALK